MTSRRTLSLLFTTTLLFCLTLVSAEADYKTKLTLTITSAGQTSDEAYILTVPDDLTITKPGWNALSSLKVQHDPTSRDQFSSSKRVVVTATTDNNFALKSGENFIVYTLKNVSTDTAATTTFEFTADEINADGGTTKSLGVAVEDYSTKPAGTYTDEITFTAEVKNPTLTIPSYSSGGAYVPEYVVEYTESQTWGDIDGSYNWLTYYTGSDEESSYYYVALMGDGDIVEFALMAGESLVHSGDTIDSTKTYHWVQSD